MPRIALPLIIEPIIDQFRRIYPAISVEIDVEDAAVELSTRGFDAGIRLGGSVEADMIAVRLTPEITWSVIGAPSYFAAKGRPSEPEELIKHECILYRFPTSGALHRGEFVRGEKNFAIDVPGKVITTDIRKTPGLYLYFPARMQTQPKLRAFIDLAVKNLRFRQ